MRRDALMNAVGASESAAAGAQTCRSCTITKSVLAATGEAQTGHYIVCSSLEARVIGCCREGLAATAGSSAPAAAGEEIRDLQLLPGGRGLLAATGDCRILLLQPEVGLLGSEDPVSASRCSAASGDSPRDFMHIHLAASCTPPTYFSAGCMIGFTLCHL